MVKGKKNPKKITPDPIVDTVIELRYQANNDIPRESVYGLIFKMFIDEFPNYKANNIPAAIKNTNPAFSHLVEGFLSNESYSIGIGFSAITFTAIMPYKGWKEFANVIKTGLTKMEKSNIVSKYDRLGLRYVNFFKDVDDISKHLELSINFKSKSDYTTNQTTYSTRISKDGFNHVLTVADNQVFNGNKGSLVDIDTSTNEVPIGTTELFALIDNCHNEEKDLFFSLLKSDFIETLTPKY